MKKIINNLIAFTLNLQLFADPADYINKTTDTKETTGNDLSPEMKEFYDKLLIRTADPNLVHEQFAQKRPIPRNNGKDITFRQFAPLMEAMHPLNEGVTPIGNKMTVTEKKATIKQYGDFIVQTDILEMTAVDNTIVEATKLLGSQAGRTLDSVVRNHIHCGTNVRYAPKIDPTTHAETEVTSRAQLDSTCKISVDVIEQAATDLKTNNAPPFDDGCYVAIIHPNVAYDLRRDPEWIDMHKYTTSENLYKGEIGKISGVRFVESAKAKINKGKDLASDSRTLAVNGAVSANATTITFDGGTVGENALADEYIVIDGKEYKVSSNTTTVITLDSGYTTHPAIADNTVIYPGKGASDGNAVYSTLIFGRDAYGDTEVEGGGLRTIIKQAGQVGNDPLDQRSSVGWKGLKTAEILVEQYMVRIESYSPRYSERAEAN